MIYVEDRVTKKVIIDPYRGGDDIGSNVNGIVEKDFNLELSKYIYDRLKSLGVDVAITRDSDETLNTDARVKRIKSIYGTGNDVVVLTNSLTTSGDGAEIVYALRNSSGLSEKLSNELNKVGIVVSKYYQRRLPSDTSKDYYQVIRDTPNNESLIVYYGNIDNNNEASYLKNNLEKVGEAIVIALTDYLNINYDPIADSNYYIVKKGDSLYSIANANNTTVDDLKEINNLTTNNLSIGQVLKLPVKNNEELDNNEEVVYMVKAGDTLYGIARRYNTTVDLIKSLNNLTSNTLSVGQKLKIPNSSNINDNYVSYTVIKGDSLYSIAKKYNTTVNAIKEYNNLSSNLLSIGQILKIPVVNDGNNNYIRYMVVSGDSLYSIAKRYNTTVNAIKDYNNLNSNLLSIGQILKIPS